MIASIQASNIRYAAPQNSTHRWNRFSVGLMMVLSAMLVSSSGCAALLGKTKGPTDKLDLTQLKKDGYSFGAYGANKPIVMEDGSPAIVLEVVDGKRSFEKIPLVSGQSMFVADVIRDADLHKKIGRIRTTVLRSNGPNRPPVRLEVDFDDSGKHVMEGQNYSLRPGDHIVVSRDERSMFTTLFSELSLNKR